MAEHIANSLRNDIMSGRYALGEALPPEQSLAEAFGVSRTVMREAVARLRAEGLISARQGLGLFVATVRPPQVFRIDPASYGDVAEIQRIVELRMGFEAEAAALAAVKRTTADLKEMGKALDDMAAAIEGGEVSRGVVADVQFHRAICVATHSYYYPAFFDSLREFLLENIAVCRNRSWSSKLTGRGRFAQAEHAAIYDAIKERDPEAARLAARTHLENTTDRLRIWQEEGAAASKSASMKDARPAADTKGKGRVGARGRRS